MSCFEYFVVYNVLLYCHFDYIIKYLKLSLFHSRSLTQKLALVSSVLVYLMHIVTSYTLQFWLLTIQPAGSVLIPGVWCMESLLLKTSSEFRHLLHTLACPMHCSSFSSTHNTHHFRGLYSTVVLICVGYTITPENVSIVDNYYTGRCFKASPNTHGHAIMLASNNAAWQ